MNEVTYPLAFLAGLVSFISPCVLPLVPSYVSYITGISFEDLTSLKEKRRVRFLTLFHSLFFVAGFSIVFISLGASSSKIGSLLYNYQDAIRITGGIIIIIFGLFISGLLNIRFLSVEKRLQFGGKPAGYLGTSFVGMAFAAGWTPCIGPILGSILMYAGAQGSVSYGVKLLSIYSLGLALPFVLSALGINMFLGYSKRILKYMRLIKIISGILLITFGILLLANKVSELSNLFPDFGIDL
ncbi:MAG: cytochrome c biogenesis protein CcdA [Nitrospirae bacterium]|nr:MAG: cytochrome c biogenesis protein CcdA [Nitrospirota bacterium]